MHKSQTHFIYSDSIEALKNLYLQKPELKDCTILSSSPSVIKKFSPSAISIYSKMSKEDFKKQREITKEIIKNTFDFYRQHQNHEVALSLSSKVIEANNIFKKLYALSLHGELNGLLICKYQDPITKKTEMLNFPWEVFLPNHKYNFYHYKELNPSKVEHDKVQFLTRIRKAGLRNILYRILLKFFKQFPTVLKSKTIMIYKENDLLMESAVEMFFRGYSLKYIKPGLTKNYSPLTSLLPKEETDLLIKPWLEQLENESKEKFSKYFSSLLNDELNLFLEYKSRWEKAFLTKEKNEIKCVMTNTPNRVDSRALFSVLRDSNIPLISFQHGVTREISKYHDLIEINFEGNTSNYFITFNGEAESISKKSHYSIAQTFAAGTSQRFLNIPKESSRQRKPLVFVSTNLPRGHTSFFMGNYDDYLDTLEEEKIIQNILNRVSKKIDFKPYLFDNRRFPDRDFISCDIENGKYENILLIKEKVDMRYLLNKYEVIITTKATSTVSWPILGNRPTVFLNFKHASPLREEVLEDFKNGIFLFNIENDDDYESVVKFLNLPIEEIKKQWAKKSEFRATLIKKYFSDDLNEGAKKAAKYLSKELSSPTYS